MSNLVDPLVGFVFQGVAHLWFSTIQLLSANVSGVAASVETAVKVGDVVVTAAHGVGGVVVTAGKGVSDTFGRVLDVASTASHGLVGYASDLTTTALIATGVYRLVAPEALGVTNQDWLLLDNADSAIASLETWSQQGTEVVVQDFLSAARVMAVASTLSYAENDVATATLQSSRWDVQVIDKEAAQAMIFKATTQPVMIVAFRGTQIPFDSQVDHSFWPDWTRDWEFLPDWLRNFDVGLIPYDCDPKRKGSHTPTQNGGCPANQCHVSGDCNRAPQVHKGFWTGWKALKDDLKKEINAFSHKHGEDIQLYVTGHSQGAALAGVSLRDLLREQLSEKYTVKGCLLFAPPKHGDKEYTTAIEDAVAECSIPLDLVANYYGVGCDPVVSVPPRLGHLPPYAAPAGRLWIVEQSRETQGPATDDKKERVINAQWWEVIGRVLLNVPRHAIGGRNGYLHAMEN